MTFGMLGEYAVAALLVCFAVWKLAASDGLDAFVWGFAILWFTGMALSFSANNRRGLWQPAGESTRAYLDLALERVRRREAAVRFAWLLYALQVAFLFAWYPATTIWSAIMGRRNRTERRDLERLRHELADV